MFLTASIRTGGGDGSPEDIAKKLRDSRVFKREIPEW